MGTLKKCKQRQQFSDFFKKQFVFCTLSFRSSKMNEAMTEALMMSDPNDVFLHPPFETRLKRVEDCENLMKDAKNLEEEVEVLKWMARRKEMEWDCTRQMIGKKKTEIREVKKKINMVRTINELGPQLNIDSDDEDTPYEDDDEDDSSEEELELPRAASSRVSFPMIVRGNDGDNEGQEEYSFKSYRKFVLTKREVKSSNVLLCAQCRDKPPLFVCSTCKDQCYCSRLCQTKHWHKHSSKCVPYESRKNPFQLCPPKPKKTGVIKFPLSESELHEITDAKKELNTAVPLKSSQCLNCQSEDPQFLCSKCKNHWYCSEVCHQIHWEEHQKMCFKSS